MIGRGRSVGAVGRVAAVATVVAATVGGAAGTEVVRAQEIGAAGRSPSQVLAQSSAADWRRLSPDYTVYLQLPSGRVVIELAPWSAPLHVENIRTMVRGGSFDGAAVIRSQDNYVAQFAARHRVNDEDPGEGIATALPAEFEIDAERLPSFVPLPDPDVYAPEVGLTLGFPMGRDPAQGLAWMAHCYGVVAVARGNDPGSGDGSSLAVVTGHGPRHLDRNSSMVGRVVWGMEHLSTLPRGTGSLSFYETAEEQVPIATARMGSDLAPELRVQIELLRTDSQSFRDYVMAYRSRTEAWFAHRADRVDLCNARVPTRPTGESDD